MATKYKVGEGTINEVNGFKVELLRYTKACQDGTSRAARFWGTITDSAGEIFTIPEQGFTVEQIDKKIGVTAKKIYNTSGEGRANPILRKLRKMRTEHEEMGLDVAEIDSKIAEIEQADANKAAVEKAIREAERAKKSENSAKIKELKKQLRKVEKVKRDNEEMGFDIISIETKMDEIKAELAELGVEI